MRTAALLTLVAASAAAFAATPAPPPAAASAAAASAEADSVRVLLAPSQETTLSSQLAGRVQAVNVALGDSFGKGKPLVRFDCDEQQARLKMSEAELASARENHEAKLRLQGLQQAGEVEVSLAASNAEKARAQVDLYKAQLAQCSVSAPFSGRVVKLSVKPYQSVTQGQALIDIVSDGPLKLRVNAPGKWVGWLKRGTHFDVQIDETGKRYRATVSALNGRIDAVSQTIEVEGTLDQRAPELLPGMSGLARFTPPRP
jgi:RND family efflux transporter MFP subunit